jgi:ferrous-iron efflux pump FieF
MVQEKAAPAVKAGIITIIMAMTLVLIKAVAFVMSGSVAVFSSVIDSFTDVLVSSVSTWSIRHSAKPADDEHRYGHGKIEGLAALFQAALIGGGAIFLGLEVISRFLNPQPITDHILIIIVMMISVVFTLVIVAIQNRAFKQSGSLAIESDKTHYSSDIITHGCVIVAVVLQYFHGPVWIDAAFAGMIMIFLFRTACEIGGKGVDMILDREIPAEQRQRLLALIEAHAGVLGVHDLRATRSGMKEIIDFDIEADPALSLHDAHAITKDLEREILEIFPEAEIMIHVDPHGETEDSRHKVAGIHR